MWPVERRGPTVLYKPRQLIGIQYFKEMMSEVPIRRLETGGESRYSVAEVARTFWPHIICCDTGPGQCLALDQSDRTSDVDSLFVSVLLDRPLSE